MTQHIAHQFEKPIAQEIGDFFSVLRRKFWLIAAVTCATMVLVLAYVWITTPLYDAKVEILIDPRERQAVDSEVMPTGLGNSAAGADTLLLESQVEVLGSHRVMDALVKSEDLVNDPEFGGRKSSGLVGMAKNVIKAVIYGPQVGSWQSRSAYDRTLDNLRKQMEIERERNTYVISVTMRTKSAEKSARLANAHAAIYIADVNDAAADSTRGVANILSSKLEDLRETANKATAAVEQYRQQNGLIDTNETLLVEQRLSDLNRELAQARSETQSALARRNQVQGVIGSQSAAALRLTEVGESTVMSQLQTRLAGIEAQEADLRTVYFDSHPSIVRLRERKSAILASLRQEYSRILQRLSVTYETAQEKEAALRAEVAALETRMAASNSDTIRLRELEREAETARTLYEDFLRRSKEAWEQVDIPNSTARVISQAYATSRPSHPVVPLLLVAGLAFGAVLGLMAAFVSHTFSRSPVPAPASPVSAAQSVHVPVAATAGMRADPIAPSLLEQMR